MLLNTPIPQQLLLPLTLKYVPLTNPPPLQLLLSLTLKYIFLNTSLPVQLLQQRLPLQQRQLATAQQMNWVLHAYVSANIVRGIDDRKRSSAYVRA